MPSKALLLGYSVGSFDVYRTKNYRIRTCVCVCGDVWIEIIIVVVEKFELHFERKTECADDS